ncbi:MAG: peptidase [Betaproteobacteria bacterium]|nr:peptidase [Betaproteobacteria bacterium]
MSICLKTDFLSVAAAISLAFVLSSCGGGGGYSSSADRESDPLIDAGGTNPSPGSTGTAAPFVPSTTVAAQCAVPRVGTDPNTGGAYADVQGTLELEKAWVRSWLDETYLWYTEIPTITGTNYSTVVSYFDALKTPATTASGNPKDKFHFTYSSAEWYALSQAGESIGYGIEWKTVSSTPPRSIVMTQVAPGSVAALAGLARGATVLMVDGADLVNGNDVNTLNAGLFPSKGGERHTVVVKDAGASSSRTVVLTSGPVTTVPVQNVKTIDTASGNVGYMLFNDHNYPSEALLINGISALKAAGVQDLVLDLRYNGGGLLDVAAELAYMIAGPQTSGKVFERSMFNDKNPFKLTDAETVTPFHSSAVGFSATRGQTLPYLGINRIYVLTSSRTCSASEAIVNGLRGAGIEVNLIGDTTCGKPYGFYPRDNCGTTFFAVQFQGFNHLGFGDYSDGMVPTCRASDDYTRQLGDPAEGQLAAALSYRASGMCPAYVATSAKDRLKGASGAIALTVPENPARNNRILRH